MDSFFQNARLAPPLGASRLRRLSKRATALALVTLSLFAWSALSDPPRIDRIERLGTNDVTIHFDTEANRKYELQYLDTLTCPTNATNQCNAHGVPVGSWSNLFVAPSSPAPNHYVWLDSRTNKHRFYRLRVTP